MSSSTRILVLVVAVGAASITAASASAQSIGCMRMPSTVGQYFGFGYGAGHHAPIVRTPAEHPDRMQRRTFASSCDGPLAPIAYEQIRCYGGSCQIAPYGEYGAAPVPVPAHQYAPAMQGPVIYQPTALRPVPGYALR